MGIDRFVDLRSGCCIERKGKRERERERGEIEIEREKEKKEGRGREGKREGRQIRKVRMTEKWGRENDGLIFSYLMY